MRHNGYLRKRLCAGTRLSSVGLRLRVGVLLLLPCGVLTLSRPPPSEGCQVLSKACSQSLARRGTVRVTCHNTMTQAGIEHNYGLLKPRHRSKQLQECTINVALRVMLRIHSQSFYLFVFYVWVSFYHSPAQCNSVVSLFGLPEFLGTTLDVAPRSSLRKLHFLSRFPQFLSTKSNSVPTQCKSLHQDAVR